MYLASLFNVQSFVSVTVGTERVESKEEQSVVGIDFTDRAARSCHMTRSKGYTTDVLHCRARVRNSYT